MPRLFVAVEVPGDVRTMLRQLSQQLKMKSSGAKWTQPEQMHVTLKFIGEVSDEKVSAIRAALRNVHSAAPVDFAFRGVGFFPDDRRPSTFWCGVEASKNLVPLATDISKSLEPLGIENERRAFVPHLTLARIKSNADARALVTASKDWAGKLFGTARAAEFRLLSSDLKPSGAVHTLIESYPFVKENA